MSDFEKEVAQTSTTTDNQITNPKVTVINDVQWGHFTSYLALLSNKIQSHVCSWYSSVAWIIPHIRLSNLLPCIVDSA